MDRGSRNEDVVYVITPEERAEYLRLKDDRDRDNSIVQCGEYRLEKYE